ncbi:hypothetical protein [Streptomyces sp. SP18BB07]|uniref:hypothetical protein n=1 Tax=Streptomyces sp. SP18BB07 TaxID=3002522 RepID=UPI002E78C007|nr:hypothetical protein [Streptomyces sp. SP18BB07]MEE1763272.1 hypothetical protein [Streptomyces sp. SP18BB07]
MAVSISVVVLLMILTVVFLRSGALKFTHAAVCVLLGFSMAGTSLAPTVQDGLTATADIVSSVKP